MDLRSIKPGLPVADLFGKVHPRTGLPMEPIGYTRDGRAIWLPMGGEGDDTDPDDPRFTGSGGGGSSDDDDDDDSDEDDDAGDDDDESKAKRVKDKSDEDDDEEETYTAEEYDRLRTRMRNADRNRVQVQAENKRLKARIAKLEKAGKSKPADDDDQDDDEPRVDRQAGEREEEREKALRQTRIENAFLRVSRTVTDRKTGNPIEWHDAEDALAVAERLGLLDDVLDTDGTVDRREMARALRELAKRKPHLVVVKKASGRSAKDSDDNDADDQRSSAPAMNGRRKGSGKPPDREALASRFPVLNRPSNR